ncbi:MAG: hypothetical protein GQ554_05270 [Deltaproteobacteria bacterium]|nr:hypothetical protein [Deltaproteobacteria bacterium]
MKSSLKILYTFSIAFIFSTSFPNELPGAPAVSLYLDKGTIYTNRNFSFELALSWEGDADQYLVAPPQITLPAGIEEKDSSFSSISRGDRFSLHYRYDLFAQQEGDYHIQPIEISYWEKGKNKEEKIKTEVLNFKVTSFSIINLGKYWLLFILAIFLLSLFVVLIVLYKRKKGGVNDQKLDSVITREMILEELGQCNAYKMEGDWENYFKKVISIRNKIPALNEDEESIKALDALVERITYGGFCPSTEEISLIQRKLERAFKNAFPDDKDKDLDGIEFR